MHAVRLFRTRREAWAKAQAKARPNMSVRLIRQLREAVSMQAAISMMEAKSNTRRMTHVAHGNEHLIRKMREATCVHATKVRITT